MEYILERLQMFSDLQFEERRHLYFLDGKIIPSVSSKVSAISPKFDKERMLPLSARKEGVTVEELDKRWTLTNKQACELGTETHDFMENFTGVESSKNECEEAGIKFLRDILLEYDIVAKEWKCYSRRYWYAGTWDLLLRHRKTGLLFLGDYKTNKDLWKAYDFLLPPFQYLESTNYNKYQVQLSLYQIMLEDVGIQIAGRKLIYLQRDGDYKVYNTYDFTEEIRNTMSIKN